MTKRTKKRCLLNFFTLLLLLLALLLWASSETWWRSTDFLVFARSVTDNSQVNCGGDGIVRFVVNLWQSELLTLLSVNASFGQIPQRSSIYHISDNILSNSFIFRDTCCRSFASNKLDVTAAFLVSSVISSFFSHFLWTIYNFFCKFDLRL